ncbi:MAG: hypothetical protein M9958_11715 [Chitinophagales bacterium]|nr:hypothetical protein [Chitinophagales bacterium]
MNIRRQIFSWISILVFLTSTTGIAVYEHICHSTSQKKIALNQSSCEQDTKEVKDCCSKPKSHSDCCEEESSFQKYYPNGSIESVLYVSLIHFEPLAIIPVAVPFSWNINCFFEEDIPVANAPPSDIIAPKPLLERLALNQAYLC